MKFFLTINWTYLNIDEIYKVEHENNIDIYSYFYMKNGEKYDVYDMPNQFKIDDDIIYIGCEQCHVIMNGIIIRMINESCKASDILDLAQEEDRIWELFIDWARQNTHKLTKKKIDQKSE